MSERVHPEGDLATLRRFEPVVRYTRGERFFPTDVDRYIQQCSLWVQRPDEPPELLVPQGELTEEKLIQPRRQGFGSVVYMKLIEPMDVLELAKYSLDQAVKTLTGKETEERFHAGRGRLARVGFGSRFVDALFSITLFLRGRVPGDSATAAALTYRRMQAEQERYIYYGRVVRESGWVALQYWYFYLFNNWRSGFFGVNDHEGDWEMVTVYCSEEDGCLEPQWVAYASHDFSGDDLRRRWDDPEVEKVGDHPVIYAGAGSHASYYAPGEYLAELEIPFLAPVSRLLEAARDGLDHLFRRAEAKPASPSIRVFTVPFVDYARGDGLSIGANEMRNWEPRLIDGDTPWAVDYRGLWGLFARDPIAGENAPAGPVYNRDGAVRRSWFDPLGWAGLDKVPPPDEALGLLIRRQEQAAERCAALEQAIAEKSEELAGLGIEAEAMEGAAHLRGAHEEYVHRIASMSKELAGLRSQHTLEQARLQAFEEHERRLRRGEHGPLRGHIRRAHAASSAQDLRLAGLAEGFAAVSIGILVIGIVLIIVFARHYLVFGLAAMIGLLIFVEAGFRRRLSNLLSSLVTGLAVVSAFILLFEFFWEIVVALVLAAGLYLIWENIREIRK